MAPRTSLPLEPASTLSCGAAGLLVWITLTDLWCVLKNNFVGLIIAFLIVFAYALVLPEPEGFPHAGKLRITASECIFGFFNTVIVYSVMVTLKDITF